MNLRHDMTFIHVHNSVVFHMVIHSFSTPIFLLNKKLLKNYGTLSRLKTKTDKTLLESFCTVCIHSAAVKEMAESVLSPSPADNRTSSYEQQTFEKQKQKKHYLYENSFADALLLIGNGLNDIFFLAKRGFAFLLLKPKAVCCSCGGEVKLLGFGDAGVGNEWGHPINNRNGFSGFWFYLKREVIEVRIVWLCTRFLLFLLCNSLFIQGCVLWTCGGWGKLAYNQTRQSNRTEVRSAKAIAKGFDCFFHPSSNRINLVKMDNNESVFAVFVFNLHTVL